MTLSVSRGCQHDNRTGGIQLHHNCQKLPSQVLQFPCWRSVSRISLAAWVVGLDVKASTALAKMSAAELPHRQG